MATQVAALNWIRDSVGQAFDTDGAHGAQCKDYINAYAEWLGYPLKPSNAAEVWSLEQSSHWLKIPYGDGSTLPRSGDIVVWDSWKESQYGHVAVVIDATKDSFRSVDQNWAASNPETGSPASIITHNYTNPTILGYLRPTFDESAESMAISVARMQEIIEFQKQMELLPQILPTLDDNQKEALAQDIEKQKAELGLV